MANTFKVVTFAAEPNSAGTPYKMYTCASGTTTVVLGLILTNINTSATSTTLVDADRLVTNDAGTMKQVALTDVKTYLSSAGFSTDDPTALAIALG